MKPSEAIHALQKQHWYKCFLLVIALFTFSIPLCKASSNQITPTEVSVQQVSQLEKSTATAKYNDRAQIDILRYRVIRYFSTVLHLISHARETSIDYKQNQGDLLLIQPILNTSIPRPHFAVDETHSIARL